MTTQNRPGLGRRPRPRARPLRPMAAAAALALIVAACSSAAGGAPSFTYAPVQSASTMPGMDMSPPASAPATSTGPVASAPAASEPASAAPPPGSPVANGATVHIAAQNIEFDTNHLDAPAGQAFTLEFDNNDPGIPHNVEIKDASGASRFKGQIITGPMKGLYQIPALGAGNYMFTCDVHPNMTGTVTVK